MLMSGLPSPSVSQLTSQIPSPSKSILRSIIPSPSVSQFNVQTLFFPDIENTIPKIVAKIIKTHSMIIIIVFLLLSFFSSSNNAYCSCKLLSFIWNTPYYLKV